MKQESKHSLGLPISKHPRDSHKAQQSAPIPPSERRNVPAQKVSRSLEKGTLDKSPKEMLFYNDVVVLPQNRRRALLGELGERALFSTAVLTKRSDSLEKVQQLSGCSQGNSQHHRPQTSQISAAGHV